MKCSSSNMIVNAKAAWLASFSSKHTARNYKRHLERFESSIDKPLDQVSRADAQDFNAQLRMGGLSNASINAIIAGCSSFYRYCQERYVVLTEDGQEVPAIQRNPFVSIKRSQVTKYGKSQPLTIEQVSDLLQQPDKATVTGARDYAMMLMAVLTGRRSAEIRKLRWKDVESGDFYCWHGKRSKERRDRLPAPCWAAIQTYIQISEKYRYIRGDDPVFTAERYKSKPISGTYFNKMVKLYADEAGLPEWVHAHTLRHTAAYLRQESGQSILEISRQLGHANIRTTQVYLSNIAHSDEGWQAAYNLISSSNEKPDFPQNDTRGASGGTGLESA